MDEATQVPTATDDAVTRFAELRSRGGRIKDAELDEVWAGLAPQPVADMIGAWRGGEFDSGHPLNGLLAGAGWKGKQFDSRDEVAPLVCVDEDGRLFSNTTLSKGTASLWMIEFRGETTASMVYDGQAVIDHFKQVDDDTVMGIMNSKNDRVTGSWFYFWLERDESVRVHR